jgi:hypothetical protein
MAMQPIVDAQRAAKLGTLQGDAAVSDAQEQGAKDAGAQYGALKAKSIFVGTDAQGNPTFSVDGQSVPSQDAANQLFEQKHGKPSIDVLRQFALERLSLIDLAEARQRIWADWRAAGKRARLARRSCGQWEAVRQAIIAADRCLVSAVTIKKPVMSFLCQTRRQWTARIPMQRARLARR